MVNYLGYTTTDNIEAYIGTALSDAQVDALYTQLFASAEGYITSVTGRRFSSTPIVGETYELRNVGPTLLLRSRPVASVEAVRLRTHAVGDTARTLVAGTEYELQDTNRGLVVFSVSYGVGYPWYGYDGQPFNQAGQLIQNNRSLGAYVQVDYTPSIPVPADITQATTLLCAHWLEYNIFPQRFALSELKSADITYKTQSGGLGTARVVPQEIHDLLATYPSVFL